jgi:hypothetical protein
MATGYDPLHDNGPKFARTMVASGTQHIAFGERVDKPCAVLARALVMKGNAPHSQAPIHRVGGHDQLF